MVNLSSQLGIAGRQGIIHPIWTYYAYSINTYNVMKRVLRTLLVTNNQFRLNTSGR